MEISRAADGAFERGDDQRFTDDVWLRSTLAAQDGTNVGVVHFAPGSRTHWRRHPGGHFHGGAPDAPLVHVAVNGGGAPERGEPVTDHEYREGF
jgi:hypothetical protein